jgi:hypothetical protein
MSASSAGRETQTVRSGGLRRFREPPAARQAPAAIERCEMCAEAVGPEHSHVVDLEGRGLLCVCRACYLLFTHEGAARGRYRAVPDRYRYDPGFAVTAAQWDELQIPVGIAFFFRNSRLGRSVAFYPSPGGATESLLPLAVWEQILAANPAMADVADDVEALLLRRTDTGTECHLVPIEACYDLVGRVRLQWKGFDGGQQARQEIEEFFARLQERSRQ